MRAARLRQRKHRAAAGQFLVEGPQAVREALAAPGVVRQVFATPEVVDRHPELPEAAAAGGVPWSEATAEVVARLCDAVHPQGVVAVATAAHVGLGEAVPADAQLVAVADSVREPGNAGTVIRIADAAGADGVVLTGDHVDPHNGKCVRASAGSLFHLPVAAGARVIDVIDRARRNGLVVLAADGAGDSRLDQLSAAELARPTCWIFGNEAHGLTDEIRHAADAVVAVPLYGQAESLNLATAAAVCLYASAVAQHAALDSGADQPNR